MNNKVIVTAANCSLDRSIAVLHTTSTNDTNDTTAATHCTQHAISDRHFLGVTHIHTHTHTWRESVCVCGGGTYKHMGSGGTNKHARFVAATGTFMDIMRIMMVALMRPNPTLFFTVSCDASRATIFLTIEVAPLKIARCRGVSTDCSFPRTAAHSSKCTSSKPPRNTSHQGAKFTHTHTRALSHTRAHTPHCGAPVRCPAALA